MESMAGSMENNPKQGAVHIIGDSKDSNSTDRLCSLEKYFSIILPCECVETQRQPVREGEGGREGGRGRERERERARERERERGRGRGRESGGETIVFPVNRDVERQDVRLVH